jgi:hypothetical protein
VATSFVRLSAWFSIFRLVTAITTSLLVGPTVAATVNERN